MSAKRVIIVGAGISGLSLAYFLNQKKVDVEIFESSARPGGMLQTECLPGLGIAEAAANAFLNSDLLESICADLKLNLLPTQSSARKRYFFRSSHFSRWPLSWGESLGFAFRFLLFLFRGKSKLPQRAESILQWGERNFGSAFNEKILKTALQGIYGGRVSELSSLLVVGRFFGQAALPSLNFFRRSRGKTRLKGSVSFPGGMQDFASTLSAELEKRGVKIHYSIRIEASGIAALTEKATVVLATSLPKAADLLHSVNADMADRMKSLPMNELTTGTFFFPTDRQIPRGFGVLVAKEEGLSTLGVLFNHDIFPGRTQKPEHRSETWILNQALSDEDFVATVHKERKTILNREDEALGIRIFPWRPAFPLYSRSLEDWIAEHPELPRAADHVYLSGNYLGRIGLTQLLEQNYELSARIHKDIA